MLGNIKSVYKMNIIRTVLHYITSTFLSLIITFTVLKVEPYSNDCTVGYGFCNTGCKNEKHHANPQEIGEWTEKDNKYFIKRQVNPSLSITYYTLICPFVYSIPDSISFELYSRPPPNIT